LKEIQTNKFYKKSNNWSTILTCQVTGWLYGVFFGFEFYEKDQRIDRSGNLLSIFIE
jgi:hypothetical protein